MSQHHADWSRGATSDHMLVGAADVRRDHLRYDAMIDLFFCRVTKPGKVDLLDLDFTQSKIDDPRLEGIL